jgi:Ca2+/H+ antiporter
MRRGPGTFLVLAVMVGSALLAGIFAFTGQRVNRFEGAVLLAGFLAYAVFAFQ